MDIELIVLVTLYLAIKLYGQRNRFIMKDFNRISGARYSENDIEKGECDLLSALFWYVHPPTPQSFARYFLKFLPGTIPVEKFRIVHVVAYFIIDIAAFKEDFITEKPSNIAYASIYIAVNKMSRIGFSDK